MNTNEIVKQIEAVETLEELRIVSDALHGRWNDLQRARQGKAAASFHKGQSVQFRHNGRTITGTVERINVKTISVKTEAGRWTVSPTLLVSTGGEL